MLVLTRKLQQQIKIGDSITVTVLRVKGSTVRIGVQAPRDVRVVRGELPKGDSDPNTDDAPLPTTSLALVVEQPIETTADECVTPTTPPSAELPAAAHLPLRRLRTRRGSGTLKQMVAACATLAK
jgi:carbon storage regulator CsrA